MSGNLRMHRKVWGNLNLFFYVSFLDSPRKLVTHLSDPHLLGVKQLNHFEDTKL